MIDKMVLYPAKRYGKKCGRFCVELRCARCGNTDKRRMWDGGDIILCDICWCKTVKATGEKFCRNSAKRTERAEQEKEQQKY